MASSLTCVLKSGAPAGEAFGRGDVIGLVLDMVELKLTYYKNGKKLGDAFTNLPAGVKLYPPPVFLPLFGRYPPAFLTGSSSCSSC
jgi:hypothetical protein